MLRTTLLAPKSVRNLSKNLVSAVTCVITRKSWRYTSGYSHTKSCLDTPLVGTRSEWPVTMPGFVTLKFQWRYFWRNFDWCRGVFTKLNGCFLLIFEICHNLPLKKVEFINRGNDLFFASHPSSEVSERCDSITNRLLSSTSDFKEILPPFTKIMTLLAIMGHVSSVSSVSSNSNKSFPRDPKNTYP